MAKTARQKPVRGIWDWVFGGGWGSTTSKG